MLASEKGRQDHHLQLIRQQVSDVNLQGHGVLQIYHLFGVCIRVNDMQGYKCGRLANNSSANDWIGGR